MTDDLPIKCDRCEQEARWYFGTSPHLISLCQGCKDKWAKELAAQKPIGTERQTITQRMVEFALDRGSHG